MPHKEYSKAYACFFPGFGMRPWYKVKFSLKLCGGGFWPKDTATRSDHGAVNDPFLAI